MYCKYCGKQIDDDSRFCNHCGKPLVETTSTPGPIKVDVKADINAKLAPSVDTSWFKKLSNKQKKLFIWLWCLGDNTYTATSFW